MKPRAFFFGQLITWLTKDKGCFLWLYVICVSLRVPWVVYIFIPSKEGIIIQLSFFFKFCLFGLTLVTLILFWWSILFFSEQKFRIKGWHLNPRQEKPPSLNSTCSEFTFISPHKDKWGAWTLTCQIYSIIAYQFYNNSSL